MAYTMLCDIVLPISCFEWALFWHHYSQICDAMPSLSTKNKDFPQLFAICRTNPECLFRCWKTGVWLMFPWLKLPIKILVLCCLTALAPMTQYWNPPIQQAIKYFSLMFLHAAQAMICNRLEIKQANGWSRIWTDPSVCSWQNTLTRLPPPMRGSVFCTDWSV